MDIGSWLIHTVTWKAPSTPGDKGDPTWGTATTISARVEKRSGQVRGPGGKTIQYTSRFATQDAVRVDGIYWLPSIAGETADDTTSVDKARTPIAIETATDKDGDESLTMVYF